MTTRYVAKLASQCPPDAIVIPFIDEENAKCVADEMNAGSPYHLTKEWATGPAAKYTFEASEDDDGDSWVVLDTGEEPTP